MGWDIVSQEEIPVPLEFLRFGLEGLGREMAFAFTVGVGLALLGLIPPEINGIIFSEFIPQAEHGRMMQLFAILVSVPLSSGRLRFAQGISFLRIEAVLDHDVSVGLWDRILRLPVAFFRKTTAGDLANRAQGLYMLRNVASMAVKTLFIQGVFVVFFLAQSFWYDWKLGLAGLGCLMVFGALMVAVYIFQLRFQRKMTSLQNHLSGLTFQILTGIAKIRVAGAEERSFSRWADLFGRQRTLGTEARKPGCLKMGSTRSWSSSRFTTMAILYVLIRWSVDDGAYDTGCFMAFWSAFGVLQGAFFQVVTSTTSTLNVLPLAENLSPILEASSPTSGVPGPWRKSRWRRPFGWLAWKRTLPLHAHGRSHRHHGGGQHHFRGPEAEASHSPGHRGKTPGPHLRRGHQCPGQKAPGHDQP